MNNELTAALLTIEKCRELSGCPAGVDLQDWVKQLAAECVTLKSAIEFAEPWLPTCDDEAMHRIEMAQYTPATDRIVAGIKADGALLYAENLDSAADDAERNGYDDAVKFLRSEASAVRLFAAQLRAGADK